MVRVSSWARGASFALAAGLGVLVLLSAARAPADTQQNERAAAGDAVTEALQREIYGLSAERDELLRRAAAQSPNFAPAQWHLGNVKDARNRWLSADDFIEQWASSRKTKEYERARHEAPDTVQGQLELAEHCRQEKLPGQMQAALMRVLEHDPNHEQARAALGFVRQGPLWLSRADIEAEQAIARAREESLQKWRGDLQEIAAALASGSPKRRAIAAEKLLAIRDSSAIAAMERLVSPVSDEAALAVIAALKELPEPEAGLSLARHAVMYPSLAVREAASAALAAHDVHSYVPALIDLMVKPVETRVGVAPLPGGRIGFRQVFLRETNDREEALVMDTEYERINRGGSAEVARRRAATDILRSGTQRIAASERRNDATLRLNERIAWVLNRATQQDLPASAETWWQWWNQQNEIQQAGPKTQVISQIYRRVQITDPVLQLGGGTTGGGGSHECLVAGTLVWTASGPWAVEKIQRGDLVLSQNVETGELGFRPVLRTTSRPEGKIVKFTAGLETFECSGGHVFWVSGEGWKKASQLEPGMLLHTVDGPLPVRSVETGRDAETFNLVVADFASYFVGQQRILSHDFTLRQPTSAIVPGLKPE